MIPRGKLTKWVIVFVAIISALVLSGSATAKPQHASHKARAQHEAALRWMQKSINTYRQKAQDGRLVMGMKPLPVSKQPLGRSLAYNKWVRDLWKHRAATMQLKLRHPPHMTQWSCIHRYEGAWNSIGYNKYGVATYYGGLQMDHQFMATYAPQLVIKYGGRVWRDSSGPNSSGGEAIYWTPVEQMWAAERAYRTRGFYPWPITAQKCGLI